MTKTQGSESSDRAQQGSQPTDEELIARFQNGDTYAFDLLVRRYKDPLLNFIFRFLGDLVEAEDIVQETFYRVYKNKHYYKEVAKFSTWIYRIATNVCLNEIRTGKYKYELELKSIYAESEGKLFEAVDQKTTVKTDEKIEARERSQTVRDAIAKLPKKQRLALILNAYDQLSYKEIAQRLACSEGAVKSIIHRAKLAIRDLLQKEIS